MKSLNQIIAELETFANVHYQIHTFGHGDVWEIAPNSSSIVYPILWFVPQGATTGLREVTTNFTVLCMDLVRSGEENETEVLSDTLQIILDVVSYYRQQHDQNYIIEFGSNIQPFTERDPDMLAGHSITVSIRQPFNYSECAIPFSGAPTPIVPTCAAATIQNASTNPTYQASVSSGGNLVLPQVKVLDSDGITEILADYLPESDGYVATCSTVCADATVQLNGTTIGTVPSGDSDSFTVNLDGSPSGVWDGTAWQVTSAPCADATVELNGVEMTTIPSGDTENISIRQSSGATEVGSKQGVHWRIDDSAISINGSPVADVKAEDSLDIDVTQDGSPVGSWNGSAWIVPTPIVASLSIGVYSDAGLTNPITSADFQQVVYIQLHVVGITATEFRFMVFNASDNGVLYVEAGTPLTYTIASFNDLLIYGEATDGTDVASALTAFELTINADVDANAYIADHNALSGLTMGSIQQTTIQGTLQRFKGTGTTNGSDLWTKFKNAGVRIFAYTPVNDTTVSIPAYGLDLIQRATKTFHGYAPTDFQVTGLRGGGGKYTKTGMFATSFALNSLGGNVYVRDNTIDGAAFGAIDGANFFSGTNGLMLFFRTVAQNQLSPRSNSPHTSYLAFPDRTGLIGIQRSTSSAISYHRNGDLINTLTGNNSTTQNPLEIYGHALNANGTPSAYHAAEYAWLCPAMPALTANEMIDYNEVVQYYQENIITGGRNV